MESHLPDKMHSVKPVPRTMQSYSSSMALNGNEKELMIIQHTDNDHLSVESYLEAEQLAGGYGGKLLKMLKTENVF